MKEKEAKFQEQRRRTDEEDKKAKAAALLGGQKLPGLGSPTMKPESGDGNTSGDDQDEWTEEEDDEEPQTSQGQRDVEKEAFTDEEGDETPVERIQTFVADAAEVDTEGTRDSNNQQRKEGKKANSTEVTGESTGHVL